MIRVLFVCLGNICRSPMAEGIFTCLVKEAGLADRIEADSAGTADWEIDSAPHPGTLYVLEGYGIDYTGQGRRINAADLQDFDYVIGMDDENTAAIRRLPRGKAEIAGLMDFVSGTGIREIPDPYFDNGFEIVHQLIRAGAEGLLSHIRQKLLSETQR